jgi:hypothetical protein
MRFLLSQLFVFYLVTLTFGQERPTIFVDNFDFSRSYRSNVCDRQRDLWNGLRTLPDALNGLNITVVLPDFQNDFSQDSLFRLVDGKIQAEDPGLLVTMMDEVAKRSGFQWRNSFGTFRPLNPDIDGEKTWADILLWSIEVYDVSAEIWGRSIERIGLGVSFPVGWYDSSIVFVDHLEVGETQEVINIWAFLTPFNTAVWFINFAFVIFTGLLYWWFERLNADTDENGQNDTPATCIYHASMVITGNFGFRPNTHASRFLSFTWTLWVLVVSSAYVANLASHLVTKEIKTMRIETIEQALHQNAAVCVEAGAVVEAILRASYPQLNLIPKATNDEMFSSLRLDVSKGGCDVVAHRLNGVKLFERNKAINYDCSISSTKRVQVIIPAGFATVIDAGTSSCTSLISAVIDYHLQMMIDDGFVDKTWKAHMSKVGTIECLFNSNDSGGYSGSNASSMRNGDVGGIFILHIVLALLSILLAVYPRFETSRLIEQVRNLCSTSRIRIMTRMVKRKLGRPSETCEVDSLTIEKSELENDKKENALSTIETKNDDCVSRMSEKVS